MPAWHPHPDVWLLFGSIIAGYLIVCRRHEEATGTPTEPRKRRLFFLGMAVLWVGADYPIHDLAENYLYSAHMVQHMLFTLAAAPILLAGMPAWLMRDLLRPRPVRTVWRFLTRPLVALVFFNAVLLFSHWPAVVEASVGSALTHFSLHGLIVLSALVMWWPVVSPLPEMPSLPAPGQMMYLFFQSLAPTIPASFLTFGHHPLYPIYGTFPRIWGVNVLDDQLMAGLIMKLVGGMILWTVIAVVFFRWGARENREGFDALAYRDVEREIRAELSR
ncbi:MAG: cytochrome c oxidase assembly protein [Actinomycetota bacterium]